MATTTRSPHDPVGLDLKNLRHFMDTRHPGLVSGSLTGTVLEGGRSNLTYLVGDGTTKWVVRRPPLGDILPTAHDVVREYLILDTLVDTTVPVPRPLALCTAETEADAPFYVMEYVEGTVYRSDAQLTAIGPQRTRTITDALIDTLVELHHVNPADVLTAVGGRPEGFLQRQLERWTTQLDRSRNRDLPVLDALAEQLSRCIPASGAPSIVHGDYRLDNTLVDKGQIVAVLDWEMATVGDPLTDVALMIAYGEAARIGVGAVGTAPGYPSAREIGDRYARATRRDVSAIPWYLGLSYFKLAVIAEGIHNRFTRGHTVGGGFADIGSAVTPLAQLGTDALKE